MYIYLHTYVYVYAYSNQMGVNLFQLGELVADGEHFEGGLLGRVAR